jgi:hypothetical protein
MRRGLGQALRIGVSRGAVSLLRSSRWRGPALAVLAECACAPAADDAGAVEAIGAALEQLLQGGGYAGWPASVVLDDELTRLWRVAPPPGASRPADLDAAAAMRFQALYGEPLDGWRVGADWQARAPFYAAAPGPLLAQIERVAGLHGLAVVAVVPHFIAAWNRWQGALAPGAWFGLVHRQLLTIGAVEGARLRAVRTLPVPHGAEHYWLGQTLAREALLLNLAAPALLQVCGAAPPAWGQAPAKPGALAVALLQPAAPAGAAAWPAAVALARCGTRT